MPRQIHGLPDDYNVLEHTLAREIGQRIRQRRITLQLSQEAMRAKLEMQGVFISRTQYSRIEKGESHLKALEIIGLSKVLEKSCDWLLLNTET